MQRDAYWKVQVWNTRSFAWIDIQRAYDSYNEADAARPVGRTRIIEVTPLGRGPVPLSDRTL